MFDSFSPSTEKLLQYVLITLGLVFVAIILHAVLLDRINQFSDILPYRLRHTRPPMEVQPDPSSQRPPVSVPDDSDRTLIGSVILISNVDSFIRLAVKGEAAYSIGFSADTKIMRNGVAIDIRDVEPFAPVSVVAVKLPTTGKYDFLAKSIEVAGTKEKTIEERTADLVKMNRITEGNL